MYRDKIINGRSESHSLYAKISLEVSTLNLQPKLGIIITGDNPASHIYVNIKTKRAQEVGIDVVIHTFQSSISEESVLKKIHDLNQDNSTHGILVQMPLPDHMSKHKILNAISPQKDVDGFSPINVGRLHTQEHSFIPCTPLGIIHLIKSVEKNLSGKSAVVIGRSNIVGRPTAELLLQEHCSVTTTLKVPKHAENLS